MESTSHYIAQERRRRRLSYKQLKQEDTLRAQLGGDPRTALTTGTTTDKERAVRYYATTGQKDALEGADLSGVDMRATKLRGFSFKHAVLDHAKLGDASGANFNFTRSIGLQARGSDISGSSWHYSMVMKADMENSNRRNMQAGNALFAFTNSRNSDSANFAFSGIGFMNNHAGETLTGAKISGWNLYSNFSGTHAEGAEISGRVQGSDFSQMNISKGSFKVRDEKFTLHGATFDDAIVDFGNTRDAESANLDKAVIQNDQIAAVVEANLLERMVPAARYDVLRQHMPAAPTARRKLQPLTLAA